MGVLNPVAGVGDPLVMRFLTFAENLLRTRPFRLTGCGESEKLPATSGELKTFRGEQMTAITTKFQVGAAALAVGAAAAFAPAAANAAPAVEIPAAPVQLAATFTRSATFWTDTTIARYEAALARHPDSFFATGWQTRIGQLQAQRAAFGKLNFSVCRDGQGITAGPYGTVTRGDC